MKEEIGNNKGEIIIYQSEDGKIKLDVIISVGYRVKSIVGTRFRQWATERLAEYIIKGFTMNDGDFREMSADFSSKKCYQFYRDNLDNFSINYERYD